LPEGHDGILKVESADYLDGKEKVEARIHQVSLSGKYRYRNFESKFKKKVGVDSSYSKKKEGRNYNTKLIIRLPPFMLKVFVDPDSTSYAKPCWIEVSSGEESMQDFKELLRKMEKKLPGLTVAKVEYATDQFCTGADAAAALFDIELEHLYIRYQRNSYLYGGSQFNAGKKDRLNYVYYPSRRTSGDQMKDKEDEDKFYERGPDSKKEEDGGWLRDVIDRVRAEHTAKTTNLKKKGGIHTLSDLLKDSKFYELNHDRYQFRHFNSRRLPKPWEAYSHKDKNDNPGMFLVEYQHYRKMKILMNISRSTLKTVEFEKLLDIFDQEWIRFDEEWKTLRRNTT
jgi:hypothetical protein